VKQTDAAGAIYDLAKNAQSAAGTSFVRNLTNAKRGQPRSRVMWPTVTKNLPLIMVEVDRIVEKIEGMYSAEIAADTALRQGRSARASVRVRSATGQFGKMVR